MDDSLPAEFQSAFSISGEVNNIRAPHPHYTLYKQKRDGFADQEARRKRLLEGQKARRRDYADYARRIAGGELIEEDEMEEGEGCDEVDANEASKKRKQEKDHSSGKKKQKPVAREKKKYYPYRNQLMQSEWLVEVPADFESKWHAVVCPVGRRSLVVASRGTTLAYSRSGECLKCFPSNLPGGCAKTHRTANDYCILDCIYVETARTYFVLDLMCWNGHPVYDSDREFRSFWLKTKLAEASELVANFARRNPFKFLPLTFHSCSKESLTQLFDSKWPLLVDGLLFFHIEAHYTTGTSPLVVWLKPHMVPDILGVPVSQEFLACAPAMSETKMETADNSEAKMETAAVSDAADICSEPKMVAENDVSANCEQREKTTNTVAPGDQSPVKEPMDSATEGELSPQTVTELSDTSTTQ